MEYTEFLACFGRCDNPVDLGTTMGLLEVGPGEACLHISLTAKECTEVHSTEETGVVGRS